MAPPPPAKSAAKTVRLYILRARLPAGLNVKRMKELGKPTTGHSVNTTYVFTHEMRRQVMSLRQHYRYLLFKTSIPFYGLRLVREEDLPVIEGMVTTATTEFKKLHESLDDIRVVPVPLDLDPSRTGGPELIQAVHDAAASHVYSRIVERLKKLAKREQTELPEKSRRALLELTKKLAAWNILDSKDITETLEKAAQRFAEKNLDPVMEDLEEQVKKFSSEGSWVEL